MKITIKEEKNYCIFKPEEQLNHSNLKELNNELNNFLQNDARDAIIDLEIIDSIDSTILASFMTQYNNFKSKGRNFKLKNPSDYIKRIIELASLDEFLLEE